MESNFVKVELEALPQNQGFARGIASSYCAELDPTLEELTEIKTAVSEAMSNSIIHGYGNCGKGKILIELKTIDNNVLWIKITDFGKGIEDIKRAMEPMFSTGDNDEMSGMGFTVMESFVDKVLVESKPDKGTAVTLVKRLDTYYGV